MWAGVNNYDINIKDIQAVAWCLYNSWILMLKVLFVIVTIDFLQISIKIQGISQVYTRYYIIFTVKWVVSRQTTHFLTPSSFVIVLKICKEKVIFDQVLFKKLFIIERVFIYLFVKGYQTKQNLLYIFAWTVVNRILKNIAGCSEFQSIANL